MRLIDYFGFLLKITGLLVVLLGGGCVFADMFAHHGAGFMSSIIFPIIAGILMYVVGDSLSSLENNPFSFGMTLGALIVVFSGIHLVKILFFSKDASGLGDA